MISFLFTSYGSLYSQTNELYQLAAVAFCLLSAWVSDCVFPVSLIYVLQEVLHALHGCVFGFDCHCEVCRIVKISVK